ncbi:hypothetical protein [Paraburkholderia fynbosensis]|uniref:Uncharacterized protein n=1 Tax=Paraburkholderia fynbosensis TaxID=1200993 RepID=A0A6J5GFB6_9BURK|nr:hypothetical protein LMG27177_04682 [Paraburkholderia fynbosensis]
MTDASKHSQCTSRPAVDALQYEKLALAAFRLCDRQREQLDKLVTLAASVCWSPAVTNEERAKQRTLLQLLVDTGEADQRSNECDSELFQVIALDAKGVAHSRITARDTASLLSDAV